MAIAHQADILGEAQIVVGHVAEWLAGEHRFEDGADPPLAQALGQAIEVRVLPADQDLFGGVGVGGGDLEGSAETPAAPAEKKNDA